MKRFFKKAATTVLAAALVLPAGLAGAAPMFPDVNSKTVTPDVQEAIEALASQGIIKGFPDGTFGPNKAITRAQFAKILAQIEGLQPNPAAASQFTDVKDPEQKGWVGALYAAGLTTGTTATTYSPNKPIQRDQAATFLVRALELTDVAKELDLTPTTTDGARINASHKANVGLLEKVGLIKGYPNGSFGPGDPFKRQQAANLLYKVQQNGDEYVSAAKALVNKVEVTQNEDGTLTIKAEVNGAAKADVAVTQTVNEQANVLFEKKGVEPNEEGVFEVTTDKRFVAPGTYTVTVTAYNAEGAEIAKLTNDFKVGEGEVKGYTDAPDLVRVYSEGKYVYFVFDEEIDDIEDEHAFFIASFSGGMIKAKEAKRQDDKKIVKAKFYTTSGVAVSTLAGVEDSAVSDKDSNENVEAVLPLNNVKLDKGATAGNDLKSVKIDSFTLKEGETETIEAEFVFDEEDITVINASYEELAPYFVLYLKDGTPLYGSAIKSVGSDSVTVNFYTSFEDGKIKWYSDEDYSVTNSVYDSQVTTRFSSEIERDDVAVAAVLPGVVWDDDDDYGISWGSEDLPDFPVKGNSDERPNPLTTVGAETKVSATYLSSAEIDLEEGEVVFKFSDDVEEVLDDAAVEENFAVVAINGVTKYLETISGDIEDISFDSKEVTVEFKKESNVLKDIVAVGVKAVNISDEDEDDRIVAGSVAVSRSVDAGDSFGPVLESISSEYDEDDEVLTVTFKFSIEIDEVDEDRFKLYDAEGEEISGDVTEDDITDNEVVIEFEIDEEEYEDAVVVALEEGAVKSGEDYRYDLPNVPVSMPLDK